MENINLEYLREFRNLRERIKNKEAVWQDVLELREKYDLPYISKDALRRGVLFYDEYDKANLIKDSSDVQETDLVDKSANITTEIDSKGMITSQRTFDLSDSNVTLTSDNLLKAHGYDPKKYELISAKNSQWETNTKNGVKRLCSSKVSVKPIKFGLDEEDLLDLSNFKPQFKDLTNGYTNFKEDEDTLVICLFDVHFGRVSWVEETGEEYNLEIARRRVLDNILKYKDKYKSKKFNKIIFIIGQDYFNSASNGYTSSNRYKQDNGNTFRAIFKRGTQTLIEAITLLSSMAPVHVMLVEGNHGREEEFMMAQVIEAYFKDSKKISVDSSPTSRKYIKIGNSTVGFAHGSEERERLFTLMQNEVPGYWATTNYRIWLTGHLHSLKVESKGGVDVWSIPALTGNDSWSEKKGYHSRKCSMGFIFNNEDSLTDLTFVNV